MQECSFVMPIFDSFLAPRDYLQMVQIRVAVELEKLCTEPAD